MLLSHSHIYPKLLNLSKNPKFLLQKDPSHWEVVDPLPSYGRGIDLPGKRYKSLINGNKLHDVVVTGNKLCFIHFYFIFTCYNILQIIIWLLHPFPWLGDNGTIDGQGLVWWDRFTSHSLKYNRPHLIEFLSSENVIVSNLTFLNAPAYSIYSIYSR